MTKEQELILQSVAANIEALALFDDNPNLYQTHGGTWETLNNAVNTVVETLLNRKPNLTETE